MYLPACLHRLKNSDKVPGFVDRSFRPEVKDVANQTLRSQPTAVAGRDRYMYFRRPLLAAPQVIIKQAPVVPVPPPPPPIPEPKVQHLQVCQPEEWVSGA